MYLIDADAMCELCGEPNPIKCGFCKVPQMGEVDAAPVVHGVWERSIDNDCPMHKCSVCGARVVKGLYEYENPNRYCYHCGAKMDGERRSE